MRERRFSFDEFKEQYGFWRKHAMRVVKSGRFYEYLGSTVMSVFFYIVSNNMVTDIEIRLWGTGKFISPSR